MTPAERRLYLLDRDLRAAMAVPEAAGPGFRRAGMLPGMVSAAEVIASLDVARTGMHVPTAIVRWLVEIGRDATGDRAVWVWAIIADSQIDSVWPFAVRNEVRRQIADAVREVAGSEVLVYVRFRLASEQASLRGDQGPESRTRRGVPGRVGGAWTRRRGG